MGSTGDDVASWALANREALAHDDRSGFAIAVTAVTLGIAGLALALRLFTRCHIINFVGVDDYLAIASFIGYAAYSGVQITSATKYLGRHVWDLPDGDIDLERYLLLFYIAIVIYNAVLLLVKMTFIFQYYRVFNQVRLMRHVYHVAMVVVFGWGTAQIFLTAFSCNPPAMFWDLSGKVEGQCLDSNAGTYANGAGTIITDVIIVALPLPSLWKLKMPLTQKLAVLGIFTFGLITCTFSFVRLSTLHIGDDMSYEVIPSVCLSAAELCSAITCAALATVRPFLSHYIPSIGSGKGQKSTTGYMRYGDYPTLATHRPSISGRGKQPPLVSTYELQNKGQGDGDEPNTIIIQKPPPSQGSGLTRITEISDHALDKGSSEDLLIHTGVQTHISGGRGPQNPVTRHESRGSIKVKRDVSVEKSEAR